MIGIRELRKAMHEIAERKGDFTLFAVFMPVGAPLMAAGDMGTWDLVVAAPWLEDSLLKNLQELLPLLRESLGRKVVTQFSSIQPVPADDPRIRFILKNFRVEDGELPLLYTDLLGKMIERGIIFRSWKPRAKKPAKRKLQPVAAAKRKLQPVAVGASRSRG
ncbi:MAG: hypothetical protein ACLQU1_09105 [Bryobacteraceae bacterium]